MEIGSICRVSVHDPDHCVGSMVAMHVIRLGVKIVTVAGPKCRGVDAASVCLLCVYVGLGLAG